MPTALRDVIAVADLVRYPGAPYRAPAADLSAFRSAPCVVPLAHSPSLGWPRPGRPRDRAHPRKPDHAAEAHPAEVRDGPRGRQHHRRGDLHDHRLSGRRPRASAAHIPAVGGRWHPRVARRPLLRGVGSDDAARRGGVRVPPRNVRSGAWLHERVRLADRRVLGGHCRGVEEFRHLSRPLSPKAVTGHDGGRYGRLDRRRRSGAGVAAGDDPCPRGPVGHHLQRPDDRVQGVRHPLRRHRSAGGTSPVCSPCRPRSRR